jgi:hypothetical protein
MSKSRIHYKTALVRIVAPIAFVTVYLSADVDRVNDSLVVLIWAAILLGQYFYFAAGTCLDLASALNINVLSQGSRK